MVLGAGWLVFENRVREGLEHMVDERRCSGVIDPVLKFGARCVSTLSVIDHAQEKVTNIFDVVLFDRHYDLSQALACSTASETSLVSFFFVSFRSTGGGLSSS